MSPAAFCDFDPGQYLVIGPNVGPLQYYSHLPVIVLALALAFFVLFSNRRLVGWVFFSTILSFVLWVFFDSVIWATNRSDVIMFMWSLQILIEPLVYFGSFYLLFLLLKGEDVPFRQKLVWSLLYLPLVLIVPTEYALSGFDLSVCLANETIFSYYSYVIEILLVGWTLILAIRSYRGVASDERGKVLLLTTGVLLFLAAFSWGNIVGSLTEDWDLAQYGLFGMPIFTLFLVYGIVRYKTFNVRLVGAVALVFGLMALTFGLLFVNDPTVFRGVSIATFIASVIFGVMLIRGVNREVRQREKIEELAHTLETANERQETLIHFIGHEVKGFLTKDAGAFAALVEGDLGQLPETAKPFVASALAQSRAGADSVGNILKASNLKRGTVTYIKAPFDLKALVAGAVEKARASAEQKGLKIEFVSDEGLYQMLGDASQLNDHVLRNLIENSINYTPAGSITVSLKNEGGKLVFAVKDTGVGISAEDKKRLFTEGGHGAESQRVNVHSTGYGLYIAKQITEAHGGTIRAESEGAGKGSTFIAEFPSTAQAGGVAPARTVESK